MNKKFVFVYCNDISPIEDYVNSLGIFDKIIEIASATPNQLAIPII